MGQAKEKSKDKSIVGMSIDDTVESFSQTIKAKILKRTIPQKYEIMSIFIIFIINT